VRHHHLRGAGVGFAVDSQMRAQPMLMTYVDVSFSHALASSQGSSGMATVYSTVCY
jgi:hypothetical protein